MEHKEIKIGDLVLIVGNRHHVLQQGARRGSSDSINSGDLSSNADNNYDIGIVYKITKKGVRPPNSSHLLYYIFPAGTPTPWNNTTLGWSKTQLSKISPCKY